jgi:hypothetical protein
MDAAAGSKEKSPAPVDAIPAKYLVSLKIFR